MITKNHLYIECMQIIDSLDLFSKIKGRNDTASNGFRSISKVSREIIC